VIAPPGTIVPITRVRPIVGGIMHSLSLKSRRFARWDYPGPPADNMGDMSIEANQAIVRRFFEEYWNQRKLETLGEYVSPERLDHFGTKAEAHGPNQMHNMNRLWSSAAPDFRCHVEQLIGKETG